MPYRNLQDYTSVRILKKVHDKVRKYADISGKPLNIVVMELLNEGIKNRIGDNSL